MRGIRKYFWNRNTENDEKDYVCKWNELMINCVLKPTIRNSYETAGILRNESNFDWQTLGLKLWINLQQRGMQHQLQPEN